MDHKQPPPEDDDLLPEEGEPGEVAEEQPVRPVRRALPPKPPKKRLSPMAAALLALVLIIVAYNSCPRHDAPQQQKQTRSQTPEMIDANRDADATAERFKGFTDPNTGKPISKEDIKDFQKAQAVHDKQVAAATDPYAAIRLKLIDQRFTSLTSPNTAKAEKSADSVSGRATLASPTGQLYPGSASSMPGYPNYTTPNPWQQAFHAAQSQQSPVNPQAAAGNAPESQQSRYSGVVPETPLEPGMIRLREGTTIEGVTWNRLVGDFTGPLKVMVQNPVVDLDTQQIVIPAGAMAFGEVQKVGGEWQSRLAVTFHRIIYRPHSNSEYVNINLDQFKGLSGIGETALKDKVNRHYMQMFGAAAAIGAIGGLAQIGGNYGNGYSPMTDFRVEVGSRMGQEATQAFQHFLNRPSEIEIREGHPVLIWLSCDIDVPQP